MSNQFQSIEEESSEVQTRNLDVEIAGHKKAIELAASLKRLQKNADFKKLIKIAYMEDFAKNLIMQRAHPDFRDRPVMMESNTRKIDSIGELNYYLSSVKAMGAQAESSLKEARKLENKISLVGK